MRLDILEHCEECTACKLRKAYNHRPKVPVQKYPVVGQTMKRLHMDLTGKLPKTEDGNEYVMVAKDFQSKFVWLFPLKDKRVKDKREKTIAGVLVQQIYKVFGPPEMLVSDRGREFRNKTDKVISELYKIRMMTGIQMRGGWIL